jgi:hypothetical protein
MVRRAVRRHLRNVLDRKPLVVVKLHATSGELGSA